jgi:aspartyl-tRNA(Asn)/glutamyl-tRNA(Gln) amidotransferase subunit C
MAVSREDVLRIAALARIAVPADRLETIAGELSGILRHMQALDGVENADAVRLVEDSGAGMLLRSEAPPGMPLARPREALAPGMLVHGVTAPAMRDGFYLVPRLATHEDGADAS